MSQLIIPEHHSLADWDFSAEITRALDHVNYYWAPSSLRGSASGPALSYRAILCRRANCQCVPEGQIRTAWSSSDYDGARPGVCFHNQAALGVSNLNNCYFTEPFTSRIALFRRVNSVNTHLASWVKPSSINTWYGDRYSFWLDGPNLIIRLERWDGTQFQVVSPDFIDTSPPWKDSTINRLGLGGILYGNKFFWYDETYLYKRV